MSEQQSRLKPSVDIDDDSRYPAFPQAIEYSPWQLPGHGRSKETCGKFWAGSYCHCPEHHPEKVYVRRYLNHCSKAECPVCYESWAAREARAIEHRISKYKLPRSRPIHVVASPPAWCIENLSYEQLRETAYVLLMTVGMIGGCMIFHPFRLNPLSFSPHFHVIGYGWIVKTAENYERSGWVVKNLKERKSVRATAQYLLSHAGVWMKRERKKTTITWFGKLSYAKFPCKRDDSERCPLCNCKLLRLPDSDVARIFGEGDPPPLEDGRRALVQQGTITREAWRTIVHGEPLDDTPELTSWEVLTE